VLQNGTSERLLILKYARTTPAFYQSGEEFFDRRRNAWKLRLAMENRCGFLEISGILRPGSKVASMSDLRRLQDSCGWVELNELSDAELLACLVAGDHTALAVIFDRYHRLVFSVAVRILRDEGEAEDVVQTVFLNIFESAINFDPLKGTLKVWLLQYAYHRAINRRRSLSAQGVYLWDKLDGVNERGHTPEMETLRYCEQMLLRLKPLQRQVLELTYFEGWTAQEIADLQCRAAAHVRNDLYRGLAKLRSLITSPLRRRKGDETGAQERGGQVVDPRTF
jgi:RNA polymerase sigma-70 factor (ECF subfamily)